MSSSARQRCGRGRAKGGVARKGGTGAVRPRRLPVRVGHAEQGVEPPLDRRMGGARSRHGRSPAWAAAIDDEQRRQRFLRQEAAPRFGGDHVQCPGEREGIPRESYRGGVGAVLALAGDPRVQQHGQSTHQRHHRDHQSEAAGDARGGGVVARLVGAGEQRAQQARPHRRHRAGCGRQERVPLDQVRRLVPDDGFQLGAVQPDQQPLGHPDHPASAEVRHGKGVQPT